MTAVEETVIQAEGGYDAVVGFERRVQGGVLMHPQVAPEPDDRAQLAVASIPRALLTANSR